MSSKDWSAEVTDELKSRTERVLKKAYENGVELREDALLLFNSSRYSRATALAILAEEEFSKAFIMKICLEQKRWDSNIFKALRKHSDKQGISTALRSYYEWFIENYKRVTETNNSSISQNAPAMFPNQEQIEELLAMAKSTSKKPKNDFLKQDSLYVGLDKDANLISTPNLVGKLQAEQVLKESFNFQVILEVSLGDFKNLQI